MWRYEEISGRKTLVASVAFRAALPRFLLAAVFWTERLRPSGVVQNEDAAVTEGDFLRLPGGALVEAIRVGFGGIPGTVEPVEVGLVVGDPSLDGLPGRLDGLHGLDIEGGRWWTGKVDDSLPQAVEAEEKFDLLGADEGADGFHGALAAGAFQGVSSPHPEDEVAPEGAHVPGSTDGRGGDEEDLGRWRGLRRGDGFGRRDEALGDGRGEAAGLVGVDAVVADGLLALGREVKEGGGDEVGGFEDLEVPLGVVVAFGAVDDRLGGGVPGDLLEGERMTEEVFGEAFAAGVVVGGDGLFAAIVDVESGVFPGEEVGELAGTDEPGVAEGVEEVVAEEFDGGSEVLGGHAVEAAIGGEESVGGQDVEVRVEDEVVAEGVDGGDGTDAPVREAETSAETFLEGRGGGVEEEGEELAALAEDATEDPGDGENELAVGHFVADGVGNPVAGGADPALMAGGAEVAALAGEGEEALVTAVWALEAGEAAGEVTALEKGLDRGGGGGVERPEGFAVAGFVAGEEVVPAVVDELPEGRGAGAARLVDGRHKECS